MNKYLLLSILWVSSALLAHPASDDRLNAITESIAEQPDNFELYLQRGEINRSIKHFSMAAEDFLRALKIGAPNERFLHHLALLLLDQKQQDEAKVMLQRAINIAQTTQPNFELLPVLYLNLAEIHASQQQWSKAADCYVKVYTYNQKVDSSVYLLAANLYIKAGSQHHSSALKVLNEGLRLNPKHLCMQKTAIKLEAKLYHIGAAIQRLKTAVNQQPKLLSKSRQFSDLKCEIEPQKTIKLLGISS